MYGLDRSTTHPKFDLTRVRTHDLQVIESTFHLLSWKAKKAAPPWTGWWEGGGVGTMSKVIKNDVAMIFWYFDID